MTVESVKKDVDELLGRMGKIADKNSEYLESIESKVLDGSVNVNDILGSLTNYIKDVDEIHDEVDKYISDTMKQLKPTNESLTILYVLSNLKSMNEDSKKRSENFKMKIVPALMILKSIGYN